MIYGISIDRINTLIEYGLMLCADLSIGMPEPRTTYVTIPEADGDLDLTGALTGGVVRYGMRQLSFSLFPVHDVVANTRHPATEEHVTIVRQALAGLVHGKKCKVWLPDDANHYFYGRLSIGERGSYNSGLIPVAMTADPWRYKTDVTELTVSEDGRVTLMNEEMPAVPTFIATDAVATVTFNSVSHQLRPGANAFDDIVFGPGMNALTFSDIDDPVTVQYQEGAF